MRLIFSIHHYKSFLYEAQTISDRGSVLLVQDMILENYLGLFYSIIIMKSVFSGNLTMCLWYPQILNCSSGCMSTSVRRLLTVTVYSLKVIRTTEVYD